MATPDPKGTTLEPTARRGVRQAAIPIDDVLQAARAALHQAPPVGDGAYHRFAGAVRDGLRRHWPRIERANARDLDNGQGLPEPLLRRIRLTGGHCRRLCALADAVPAQLHAAVAPGQRFHGIGGAVAWRVPRPLGVLLMIYEARPTVTVDGTLLAVCAGNAILLRGGTEIAETNAALAEMFAEALAHASLPAAMVQVLHQVDRSELRDLLRRDDAIDVLVPRGSPSLVDACRAISRIPMIVGGGGVNHQYVHSAADIDLAVRLVLDGKLPEPEGCTALECVLLDDAVVRPFGRTLATHAGEPDVATLRLRVDAALAAALPDDLGATIAIEPLVATDLGREFLEPTLAALSVGGLADAVAHINRYGSRHTEGIVTQDPWAAEEFCRGVDAAAVIVNGSVRLHDGPSLGLGPEIAISTGRLHVRGPVGLANLMGHGWRVEGGGAVRFRTGP